MALISDQYKDLPYYIDYVTDDDKEEVLQFLRKYFFPDEPMTKCLKIVDSKGLEEWILKNIGNGYSFKAVSKETKEIIGVRLSDLEKRDQEEEPESESKDPNVKILKTFLSTMYKQYEVFEKHAEFNNYLEAKVLCVNNKLRGLGIAPNLINRSLSLMIEKNIPIIRVLCSSFYSIRVMQKCGLNEVYRIDYADYKDDNGKQILCPEEPHKTAILFVKTLKDLQAEKSTSS